MARWSRAGLAGPWCPVKGAKVKLSEVPAYTGLSLRRAFLGFLNLWILSKRIGLLSARVGLWDGRVGGARPSRLSPVWTGFEKRGLGFASAGVSDPGIRHKAE